MTPEAFANLAFFEAYFSNFVEGTEFVVDEAAEIVFGNQIPTRTRYPGRRRRPRSSRCSAGFISIGQLGIAIEAWAYA
jgi:hypothetical protein